MLSLLLALAAVQDGPNGWALCSGGEVARVSAAAFVLEAGERLRPGAGPEELDFRGRVRVDDAGRHRFGVEAAGAGDGARLLVRDADGGALAALAVSDGETWSAWIDAPRGELEVELAFARAAGARARARVLWERAPDRFAGFGPEPIPSRFVRPAQAPTTALADRGRVLLEREGCTNCHEPSPAEARAVGLRPAPDLARVARRVRPEWLVEWIASPSAHRPGADMPDLLDDTPMGRAHAGALAHFLVGLSSAEPASAPAADASPEEVALGELLYHQVGCVACHGARRSRAELHDDPFLDDAIPAAPLHALGDVAAKWRRAELARFLADPRATHPDGRMPSLALAPDEAAAIASALVPREAPSAFALDAAKAGVGRKLFVAEGCARCHAAGDALADLAPRVYPALGAVDPTRGCLDPGDARTPRYDLTDDERAALRAGLAAVRASDGAPAPLDALERTIDALGCLACHSRDGAGGVPAELDLYFATLAEDTDLGDEGRLPPDLSEVGFKLDTAWLDRVLVGDGRSRPWIGARMPHYGAALAGAAALLARARGVEPYSSGPEPAASDALALAGRELLDREHLSCVACHVYKDFPPDGTVGPDLAQFSERLRYEWLAAFLKDPMRYRPGTRMPSFQAQGGTSSAADVLDGDLARQIDALWSFFALGEAMPPPPGVARAQGIPIAIGARPRVLRTFLEDAGARGIAVGFPAGVHFAYDAERARLVAAWRGDFLDASGAWAGRGGTASGGRGPLLWEAPEEPALTLLMPPRASVVRLPGHTDGLSTRFRGYRIEPDGTPVFLSELEDRLFAWHVTATVAERWTPRVGAHPGFDRELRVALDPPDAELLVRPGPAARVARVDGAGEVGAPGPDGAVSVAGAGAPIEILIEVRP